MSYELKKGVIKFKEKDFDEHKELFKNLKNQQNPKTLFITCSDSRVVPNLITDTKPGELFIIRNIGNIIPKYQEKSKSYLATISSIEYALLHLNIENIVICGHSNCGACKALYEDKKELKKMPFVKNWLKQIKHIAKSIKKMNLGDEKRELITERANILNSKKNLKTYPGIKKALKNKKLEIHSWHYIIETGEVFAYENKKFKLLKSYK